MTRAQLTAKKAREQWAVAQKAREKYTLAQNKLLSGRDDCDHAHVVVTCSKYDGSYSWDYDDWHPERRLCLVCGLEEGGESPKYTMFKKLLNPRARFEFGSGRYYQEKISKTPLENVLTTPLKDLLAWVDANGYK